MSNIKLYKNIVGGPDSIENVVQCLVDDGWTVNSPLLPYTPEGKLCGLFVQSMILYKKDEIGC